MALNTRLANSSLLRDANREYNEALRTCAGIPASIAACTVQRPSPLSLTSVEYSVNSDDSTSA